MKFSEQSAGFNICQTYIRCMAKKDIRQLLRNKDMDDRFCIESFNVQLTPSLARM